MLIERKHKTKILALLTWVLLVGLSSSYASANEVKRVALGNFGLPGILDLPTAKRLPDGELILTHQNHKNIFQYKNFKGLFMARLMSMHFMYFFDDKILEIFELECVHINIFENLYLLLLSQ